MDSALFDKARPSELLAGLGTEECKAIVEHGQETAFENGEIIFEESTRSSDLYLILEGRVAIEISAPGEDGMTEGRLVLALLRDGEVFGEIGFLGGSRRSARVSALNAVKVLRFDGAKLNELFDARPEVGYRVMRNLASILAQRVVDVNFKWRQDRGAAG